MALRTPIRAYRALLVSAGCGLLSGCALGPLGPLASGDGLQYAELHSHSCSGLALERQERLTRIASLEQSVKVELSAPPATVMEAVQRGGPTPEAGTKSYSELLAERRMLDEANTAAVGARCPAGWETTAKMP